VNSDFRFASPIPTSVGLLIVIPARGCRARNLGSDFLPERPLDRNLLKTDFRLAPAPDGCKREVRGGFGTKGFHVFRLVPRSDLELLEKKNDPWPFLRIAGSTSLATRKIHKRITPSLGASRGRAREDRGWGRYRHRRRRPRFSARTASWFSDGWPALGSVEVLAERGGDRPHHQPAHSKDALAHCSLGLTRTFHDQRAEKVPGMNDCSFHLDFEASRNLGMALEVEPLPLSFPEWGTWGRCPIRHSWLGYARLIDATLAHLSGANSIKPVLPLAVMFTGLSIPTPSHHPLARAPARSVGQIYVTAVPNSANE